MTIVEEAIKVNAKVEDNSNQNTTSSFHRLDNDKNGCGYNHNCKSDEILQELKSQNTELKTQNDILQRIEGYLAKDITIKERRDAQRMNYGY